jgi:hypothetical protein
MGAVTDVAFAFDMAVGPGYIDRADLSQTVGFG